VASELFILGCTRTYLYNVCTFNNEDEEKIKCMLNENFEWFRKGCKMKARLDFIIQITEY